MAKKKKNTHALKRKEEKGERTCCFTCKQTKRTSNTEKKKSCLLLYVNGLRAGKARALCTVADKSEKHTCEQAAVTQRHVSARPKEERWRKDGRKERLEKETDAVTTTHTHTQEKTANRAFTLSFAIYVQMLQLEENAQLRLLCELKHSWMGTALFL